MSELRLDDDGRERLRDAAADIVSHFLGPHNPKLSKRGRELRWHPHGSFSLIIAGPKEGCWFDHASGEGGDIIGFIQREQNCSFRDALDFADSFVSGLRTSPRPQVIIDLKPTSDDDEARSVRALAIWDRTVPLRGTLAETYLRSRCIEVPDEALEVLRFHPACPWGPSAGPCLVALVTDIVSDEPIAIHRIALTREGRKFGCMALGPIGAGAIKLAPQASIATELTIAEGIETALSAAILGFGPVWSVIDAGGIARFPVLPSLQVVQMFSGQPGYGRLAAIARLTIVADNDLSGTGQRAAAVAQANWEGCGMWVRIVTPSTPGHDANDVLKAMGGRP